MGLGRHPLCLRWPKSSSEDIDSQIETEGPHTDWTLVAGGYRMTRVPGGRSPRATAWDFPIQGSESHRSQSSITAQVLAQRAAANPYSPNAMSPMAMTPSSHGP